MESFFRSTQAEQEMRLADRIPNLEEFWLMRMGTIGVEPCLAMNEYVCRGIRGHADANLQRYALKKRLPSHIRLSDAMRRLWYESIAGLAM